jgi:hypothetical protein
LCVQLLALTANIRLELKCPSATNAPAYFVEAFINIVFVVEPKSRKFNEIKKMK